MEWMEVHQYSAVTRSTWRCWCEDNLTFENREELFEHLRKSLAADLMNGMVSNEKIVEGWRAAYDRNEFDNLWQHNSDAAIVFFVSELLGLNEDDTNKS